MNKDNDSSYSGDPESPSQVSGLAGSISSPARRKLIKIGASSVPVLATLTSQSALAANCISTSAWGSDQISGSASQRARHEANGVQIITPGFTITAWNAAASPATSPTTPWLALKSVYPGFVNAGGNFRQNTVTFADLIALAPTKFVTPAGFSPGQRVVGNLGNDDKSYFAVAQLNFAANRQPPPACVSPTVWQSILAGTYPTPGTAWTLTQIALYLKSNNIVTFN